MEKGFEALEIGDEALGLFGQDSLEYASGDEETAEGSFFVDDPVEDGPSLPLACVQEPSRGVCDRRKHGRRELRGHKPWPKSHSLVHELGGAAQGCPDAWIG